MSVARVLLGLGVAAAFPFPHLIAQQPYSWRVTAEDVRLACAAARADTATPPDPLKRLCSLSLGRWTDWSGEAFLFPDGDTVMAWARRGRALVVQAEAVLRERAEAVGGPQITVQTGTAPASAGAAPALTQAAIILGLTDFLIERTELQVQSWLLPRMFDEICTVRAGNDPLRWLLPETCRVLDGNAPRGLNTSARTLHSAVLTDLHAVPGALVQRFAQDTSGSPGLADARALAPALYELVVRVARNPASLSDGLADLSTRLPLCMSGSDGRWLELCRVARLVAGVKAAIEADGLPTNPAEWLNALRALRVNGLLDGIPAADLAVVLGRLDRVRSHVIAAQQAFADLRATRPPEPAEEAAARRARIDQYAALLTHVADAFQAATGLPGDAAVGRALAAVSRAAVAVEVGDFAGAVGAAVTLAQEARLASVFGPKAVRILGFAADISQATTPKDVTESLRAFANAAGSRAPKRSKEHGLLLGVQAYGGLSMGSERIDLDADAGTDWGDPAFFGGLYFPVGFEITLPWFDNSPVGIFVQVIDLGVLASARIAGSDSADAAPELGFAQVVAPGGFFTLAIPQTPLSAGVGISLAPKLRSLRGTANDQRSALRFGAFLAIDIGLFP